MFKLINSAVGGVAPLLVSVPNGYGFMRKTIGL